LGLVFHTNNTRQILRPTRIEIIGNTITLMGLISRPKCSDRYTERKGMLPTESQQVVKITDGILTPYASEKIVSES
tara:strand:+ start:1521 stop:1748 length:228 start_codon:yes stop_codon:yes gene_type:complete